MKYPVLAEFVDIATGARFTPSAQGEKPTLFAPHDDAQRDRLIASGCLGPEAVFDLATKPLEDLTRAELEEIALDQVRAELAKADDDELRHGVARYREFLAEHAAEADDVGAPGAEPVEGDAGGADGETDAKDKAPVEGAAGEGVPEDLSKKTVDQLKEIAEAEEVDLTGKTLKGDIVAAIEAKRQAA